MFSKIVVAYNASEEADRALLSAILLTKTVRAELHAVTVTGDAPVYEAYAAAVDPSVPRVLDADRDTLSRSLQEKARAIAQAHGVSLLSYQVKGHEVEAIIAYLEEQEADLLVVGLHPRNFYISRLWSTVYGLAQDAPCSVLGVH